MSHPARLSLRAPPHLPFIQGWPGIPSSPQRKVAAVQGTVEVRIGPLPIKAKWVRAEIRKYESVPPGFPSGSSNETWEHVGEVSTLWAAPAGKDWDNLEQADFKFFIPLPDTVAPSVEMSKGTGVRYELVAALCYRQKGGVFKKESAPIMKISEPIRITRHDVHSAWPVYNMMDAREIKNKEGDLTLTVQRPGSGFGPTDRILFTASLKSMRPKPFKLKGFECSLIEVTTVTPQVEQGSKGGKKGKGPPAPVSKSKVLATARHAVDESVGRGGEKTARMDLPVPAERLLVTLNHARSIAIRYELEVKAVCDSGIPDIGMGKIPYTVGPFARAHAQQAVRDIGYVESLCPGVPPPPGLTPSLGPSLPNSSPSSRQPSVAPGQIPALTPSPQPPFPPNGFYANANGQRTASQPIQGFTPRNDFRRKSSGTSTMTTTTTTTFDQQAHAQNQLNARPQSMQSKPNVAFPMASPAPALQRSSTGRMLEADHSVPQSPVESNDDRSRFIQSPDMGHRDDPKRYSTGTTATFGRWDKDLRMAMAKGDTGGLMTQSSAGGSRPPSVSPAPTAVPKARASVAPPSSWQSAEQEKAKLYDDARNRAAAAQFATGASLATLGLEDASAAPPEYAPPRPKMPAEEYKAPERPLSVYGARGSGSAAARAPPDPMDGASESKELVQAYQTAAEEKEQQKKRFERVHQTAQAGSSVSGNSPRVPDEEPIPYDQIFPPSASAGPSHPKVTASGPDTAPDTLRTPPRAPIVNGAVNEKEQMRRFYEAQDRVARASGRSPAASPPGSMRGHGASTPSPAAVVPGLSEKEQMRRYYEAQDRVAQAGTGQGSMSTPGGGGSSSQPGGASIPTGLSEKEQMRRFYEAQDRVAQAGQAAQAGPSHALTHGPSDGGTTGGPANGSAGGSPSIPGPSINSATAVPSALSEKEQMRRFYEAQDRVARASGQSADGHARTPSADASPNPTYFPPNSSSSQAPPPPTSGPAGLGIQGGPPMSGLSEKEQMRRSYEAQDRVARAAGAQSPPMISSPPAMDDAPAYNPLAQAGPSNGVSSPLALASPVRSPYPSAEEEKEQMRRRFEDAQAAVERKKRISSPPPPAEHPSRPSSPPPESPIIHRDPTIKAGKAKARTSGGFAPTLPLGGPPPPLPTKPPKEYINLLSPVGEPGPSFARIGMEMNGQAGPGGSAAGSGSGA